MFVIMRMNAFGVDINAQVAATEFADFLFQFVLIFLSQCSFSFSKIRLIPRLVLEGKDFACNSTLSHRKVKVCTWNLKPGDLARLYAVRTFQLSVGEIRRPPIWYAPSRSSHHAT